MGFIIKLYNLCAEYQKSEMDREPRYRGVRSLHDHVMASDELRSHRFDSGFVRRLVAKVGATKEQIDVLESEIKDVQERALEYNCMRVYGEPNE